MRSITRHFIATVFCVPIFTLMGTLDGFLRTLHTLPHVEPNASFFLSGLLNFIFVSTVFLVVLTPVASIAEYLFTRKWPLRFYVQIPALLPLLIVYLLPWTLFFGRRFLIVLVSGTIVLTLPLFLYWAIYRGLDRDFLA